MRCRLGVQTFDEPDELTGQGYRYWTLTLSKCFERFTLQVSGHDTVGVEPDLASGDLSEARLGARAMIEF